MHGFHGGMAFPFGVGLIFNYPGLYNGQVLSEGVVVSCLSKVGSWKEALVY